MEPMIDRIGGEDAVLSLVNRFYDLVESQPQGRAIMDKHLQGHGLAHVRPAQFEFLTGFFGGRRYYHERHGHMSLRDIHAHVEIRATDAEDWLALMGRAMAEMKFPPDAAAEISTTFRRAALMLVNAG